MHHSWAGELLAVQEFNAAHTDRKLEPYRFLRTSRLFQRAAWLDKVFALHVMDHPARLPATAGRVARRELTNVSLP
jgi:hypothetical protein